MSLINVEKVTKQFRKGPEVITPLQETDLQVERGEFVSLMGASGSGNGDHEPVADEAGRVARR
jgi:putative ABC transport system ATP-binding protein